MTVFEALEAVVQQDEGKRGIAHLIQGPELFNICSDLNKAKRVGRGEAN